MSDKSKTDITIRIILWVVVLIIFVLITAFLSIKIFAYKFVRDQLSICESHKWYEFGSFYSGILLPFLTFINVLVLYRFSTIAKNFDKEKQNFMIKREIYTSFIEKMEEETDKYVLWTKNRKYEELTTVLFRAKYKIENFKSAIESLNKEKKLSDKAKTKITTQCEELETIVDDLHSIVERRNIPRYFNTLELLDAQKKLIKTLRDSELEK